MREQCKNLQGEALLHISPENYSSYTLQALPTITPTASKGLQVFSLHHSDPIRVEVELEWWTYVYACCEVCRMFSLNHTDSFGFFSYFSEANIFHQCIFGRIMHRAETHVLSLVLLFVFSIKCHYWTYSIPFSLSHFSLSLPIPHRL